MLLSDVLHWADLGLQPGFHIGPLLIHYYALAYVLGVLIGFWHLTRMVRSPGSPMTEEQAGDLVFWCILGIILGGRLGYATFYEASLWTSVDLVKVWQGGMSFHGGLIGVLVALAVFVRRQRLSMLRVLDYVAVNVPFGMMLGRIANFINGELWGKPSTVPWAMVFPGAGDQPRHPSQLYEAALEGAALIVVMLLFFWRTQARWRPGLLAGVFAVGIGVARFIVEFFREPDAQLAAFAARTGLHMGQWLTLPLIAIGVFLIVRARRRPALPRADGDDVVVGGGSSNNAGDGGEHRTGSRS
ncbi:MAG: prolipoprotein diacylglyceryl transferase [Nocardioides sp.]|uniref:prolipoprotein diacylglyceryl transferase n=1 Tax=Nocardioides sp. TaxID=35761 RepID=UPI0039E3D1BB